MAKRLVPDGASEVERRSEQDAESGFAPTPDALVPAPVMKLWDTLTAPWGLSLPPEQNRRAQMLAGLVLVLITGAFLLMFVFPLLNSPGTTGVEPGLALTTLFVLVGGLLIYLVSRTRHYEAGSWLMIFGTMAWVSVGVFAAEGTPWASSAPIYLALTVVLSTVLLPLVATLFIVAVNLGLLLAFFQLLPWFGVMELSNAMMFLAIASTVLVVTALVRFFDMRQIENQAADILESEERYRSLFEASFEGLALHDNGKIMEVNQALAGMFRTEPADLVGRSITDLVVQEAREFVSRTASNVAHETKEAEAIRLDGGRFQVEFISKPYVHQGKLVQVTAIRDITERKEMEKAREKTRELSVMNQRLLEVDRMRTQILNVASHELNTPITPLRMQVHLLKTKGLGELNERQLNAVEILDRNLVRLSMLVKDILDVSKIEAGRLRLRRRPTELISSVADTVDTFAEVAQERSIALNNDVGGEAWANADADRIGQVLSNLITNALKFTPAGGDVVVSSETNEEQVRIWVQDSGVGLTPQQAARLFRPFEQAHDVMNSKEGGSGLGLYISKGIVETHGGEIGIDCDGPGKGVTVWFTLPLVDPDAPSETSGEAQEQGSLDAAGYQIPKANTQSRNPELASSTSGAADRKSGAGQRP